MPKIATNFEVGSAQPIDTRFVVQSESDLANLKVYEGLEVYIKDLKAKRLYNGTVWVEVTGGVSEEDVMNIINENSEDVGSLAIGTSKNYNIESDEQIPTTKAIKKIIEIYSSSYDDTLIKNDIKNLQDNKADRTDIPTKVSQLTNDSEFITQQYVDNAISNAITKVLNEEV